MFRECGAGGVRTCLGVFFFVYFISLREAYWKHVCVLFIRTCLTGGARRCTDMVFGVFMPTARKPGQRFLRFLFLCSKCYGTGCSGTPLVHPLHMSKPAITFVFPSKDCFGTYFTHAQTCDNVGVPSATEWTCFTHVQTCDNFRVPSATEWTPSVHILYTCPNL